MMVKKTGDERTDYLIDKEAAVIKALEESAAEKGKEIRELIERFWQTRAKRLERQNDGESYGA